MFKVGDEYRIVDAHKAQLTDWYKNGDVVEVKDSGLILGDEVGKLGQERGRYINEVDVVNGYVEKVEEEPVFKVGDKYRLVNPSGTLMDDTSEGTILTVESTQSGGTIAQVSGNIGPRSAKEIDEVDVSNGWVVKSESIGGFHMDVTLNTTTTTDVREILCRAVEQVYENTGMLVKDIHIQWFSDDDDEPYVHNVDVEGRV